MAKNFLYHVNDVKIRLSMPKKIRSRPLITHTKSLPLSLNRATCSNTSSALERNGRGEGRGSRGGSVSGSPEAPVGEVCGGDSGLEPERGAGVARDL